MAYFLKREIKRTNFEVTTPHTDGIHLHITYIQGNYFTTYTLVTQFKGTYRTHSEHQFI